jgi:hypothetical protein
MDHEYLGDKANSGKFSLNNFMDDSVWLAWRTEIRNGRPTKVPYSTPHRKAKSNDATTWTSFDAAAATAQAIGGELGIFLGIECGAGYRLGGIDLDTCRDPITGKLTDWAERVVERFGSYAEISPSGKGVKIFFSYLGDDLDELRSILGDRDGRAFKEPGDEHPPGIEVYVRFRYFAVTCDVLPGYETIEPAQVEDVRWLIEMATARFVRPATPAANENTAAVGSADKNAGGPASYDGPRDYSRSGRAYRHACALRESGISDYPTFRDAMEDASDSAIRDWVREKGSATIAGQPERELRRLFERVKFSRTIAGHMAEIRAAIEEDENGEGHATDEADHIDGLDTIGFRTRADDKIAPPPTWLIAGLIEAGSDCALYAPMQFLKSFAAIDIAYAVATGVNALGTLPVIESGPVIYYAAEGYTDVVKRRSVAWEIAHRRDAYSVDNIVFGRSAPYVTEPKLIARHVGAFGQWLGDRRAKLIVIDTLNRALAGQDEDRAHTASLYLNTAKVLREKLGGATLTIAHKSNKSGDDRGLRGSSAFEAGFDTVLEIREHRKDELTGTHTIALIVKKQKSGEDGQTYYLQSDTIELPDGTRSLALIPVSEDVGRAALDAKPDSRKLTPDVVDNVLLGITDGGNVSTDRLIEALSKRLDKSPEAVRKALDRGAKSGELIKFKAGRGRWALPEIIEVESQKDMSGTDQNVRSSHN